MKCFSVFGVLVLLSLVVCSQALAEYDACNWQQLFGDPDTRPGTPRSEQFMSRGVPDQHFELSSLSLIPGSVQVQVGSDYWEEVILFADSLPDSPHFRLVTDESEATWIIFGDGVHGAIPPAGETVTANYRETVPEPSSILALACGVSALGGMVRRRL